MCGVFRYGSAGSQLNALVMISLVIATVDYTESRQSCPQVEPIQPKPSDPLQLQSTLEHNLESDSEKTCRMGPSPGVIAAIP
jgi:hypothetical protein